MFKGGLRPLLCLLLCTAALLSGCASAFRATVPPGLKSGKALTMFVTSDVHYLAPSLHDDGKAYRDFITSGDGRQLGYVDEIVDAFANDIKKARPDVLIVSGDLTNNGERASHEELSQKLKGIEDAGTRVYVIPGNHDIQNPWARSFQGDKQIVADGVTDREFAEIYGDFGYKEAISRDKSSLSYLAAPTGDLWLLMLDSCVYKTNYEYDNSASYGRLQAQTLDWICNCAALAKDHNARIVAVMHHNLMEHSYRMRNGYTLDNAEEAQQVFRECGISLTLSGHLHIQDIKKSRETPVLYDIASSSLGVNPFQYGVLQYLPGQGLGLSYHTQPVDVAGWAQSRGIQDENLLHFAQYGQQSFVDRSYQSTYNRLRDTGLYSEPDARQMADVMSTLNAHYFAGTVADIRSAVLQSRGYKLWLDAETPEFLCQYVRSMAYDYKMDNNHLEIP